LARDRLRRLLAARPGYRIVAECADGAAAVDAVISDRPDIVFLDIQMPELDGLAVVDAMQQSGGPLPVVVFVTAYDSYALGAFDAGAIDYLLKPVTDAKLDRALARANERLRGAGVQLAELREVLEAVRQRSTLPTRFAVRDAKGIYFVATDDIDWVSADGNYVCLHVVGRKHLLRETMSAFEQQLDGKRFIRVHRSAIVNVERIARLDPHAHGEYVITLRGGERITSSRAYNAALRGMLG
jgi:two-component system LytT family response regulator